MIRFILFAFLFYIVYWVVKLLFRNFNQASSNKTVNNSRSRGKDYNYKDIQDAEFKEINPEDDKKK